MIMLIADQRPKPGNPMDIAGMNFTLVSFNFTPGCHSASRTIQQTHQLQEKGLFKHGTSHRDPNNSRR